ncbi:MAG: hypothetical protein ABI472_01850 [Ginsengibacter sp.]
MAHKKCEPLIFVDNMKLKIILFLSCFMACSSSNNAVELIQGNWYFEDDPHTYIKITDTRYIVENDSPYPEDYKMISDTLIIKGFEAKFREDAGEPGYLDTLKIVRLTEDTLILKTGEDLLMLHKK